MNRRALLKVLPLAPAAVLLMPTAQTAKVDPIDTRPAYRLSDYWVFDPGKPYPCRAHDVDHHAYTHGCQPAAFPRDLIAPHGSPGLRPATADAVPVDVFRRCPTQSGDAPHRHNNFRWINE